jgi:hypothetical protein
VHVSLNVSVFQPLHGEIVQLLSECRSDRSGRVYEIGTRARVIGARTELLTLEIEDPVSRDSLVCARASVAREGASRPRQATPWYRRHATVSRAT